MVCTMHSLLHNSLKKFQINIFEVSLRYSLKLVQRIKSNISDNSVI